MTVYKRENRRKKSLLYRLHYALTCLTGITKLYLQVILKKKNSYDCRIYRVVEIHTYALSHFIDFVLFFNLLGSNGEIIKHNL